METLVKKKLYEAMFLVDSAQTSDWDKIIATLETVLKRADGEVVTIRKWDERKLAYEIDGKTRGTYILSYFRADSEKVREIEKAVQLSEQIMRVLILSAETREKEDIEKETRAMKAEKQKTGPHAGEKDGQEQLSDKEQTEEAVKLVE
jgi:small subunit ribosomal protein S6